MMDDKKKELTPMRMDNNTESSEEDSISKDNANSVESELLKALPPEAQKIVEVGMMSHKFGPIPNPLTEKINEKHIDKILEIAEKDDD